MIKDLTYVLKKCILMQNFSVKEINSLISSINYDLLQYSKDEVIAIEGTACSKIGIVISGSIEVQKIYSSGKIITLSKLSSGNIFGEVILFSNKSTYPATIVTSQDSEILFISKDNVSKLCTISNIFLNNFMSLLSNKILMLNKKVKNISYQTLREKISSYIVDEYNIQKSTIIKLHITKKELADQLGIPRPSLSRELVNMKNENIIDFSKHDITIKDLDYLKSLI